MGCDSAETKEEKKEEKNEEKEKEKESQSESENSSYNIDKKTKEYFSNFEDKEISLILSRRKLINEKNNFSFLFSRFEAVYNDKFLSKKNKILCTEFLACYINPNYVGNFGYESQITGFFPKKVTLENCFIKGNKVEAKMINTGKIVSVLKIDEENKKDLMNNIMVFEFVYHIIQIKNYGIRLINIEYTDELLTCSLKIKYNEEKFSIKSNDEKAKSKQNEFYIFNKNKFRLTLTDNNNKISINDKENQINKLIEKKFSSEEIEKINNSLEAIDIKPLEPNLIYEKIKHELHEDKDYIEGVLLIFQPSFEKYYFDLFKIVSAVQYESNFKIKELKINDQTIINLNKSEVNKKSDNYYKSSNNSYYYNIITKEDFLLFEFQLKGKSSNEDKKKIKYNLDPKKIFNIFFSKGTYYLFEIILNGFKVSFGNDKEYKYTKDEDKIVFEGNWELDNDNEENNEDYLPKEIIIKSK